MVVKKKKKTKPIYASPVFMRFIEVHDPKVKDCQTISRLYPHFSLVQGHFISFLNKSATSALLNPASTI